MSRVTIGALALTLTLGAAIPASVRPGPVFVGDPDPEHNFVDPGIAGFTLSGLEGAREALDREIRRGGTPGAVLAVGRGSALVLEEGFGRVSWSSTAAAADPDLTSYDLASLTKVVATTAAAMLFHEEGRLSLEAPVIEYLPDFPHRSVTIRHLLTHTSGLPAGISVTNLSPAQARARILRAPLRTRPGSTVVYSDVGFGVLWYALEAIAGEPLPAFLERRVYAPLGMHSTRFKPGEGCSSCAPTLHLRNGTALRGVVHDPTARVLGGIAGHAGLFSTAHDLARFAAMLAAGGELDGIRIFEEETIRLFTRVQPDAESRALGWDTPSLDDKDESTVRYFSPDSFGHTGFTGTSLWVDPTTGLWVVVLTNRVFAPRASNGIKDLRRAVHDQLAVAVEG